LLIIDGGGGTLAAAAITATIASRILWSMQGRAVVVN